MRAGSQVLIGVLLLASGLTSAWYVLSQARQRAHLPAPEADALESLPTVSAPRGPAGGALDSVADNEARGNRAGSVHSTFPRDERPTADIVDDWPALAGPHRNCTSRETGLDLRWSVGGPRRAWERAIGTGYSAPVVAGDQLVVHHRVGDAEHVTAFDSATGDPRWEYSTPTTFTCRFAYSNGPYATPVLGDRLVFAVTAQGRLVALDRSAGECVWERDLKADFAPPEPLFGVGASPCLHGGRLYLNVGGRARNAGVVALDAETGTTVWTATRHGASYSTPVVATIRGRDHLLVFTEQGLVSLNPDDGSVRGSVPFGMDGHVDRVNAVMPIVLNDLVVVAAGPGPGTLALRVLDDGSLQEAWRDARVLDSTFSNLAVHDGRLFGFSSRGRRHATFRSVDFATGRLEWEFPSALQRGANVVVDGHAILLGEYGHLAALRLDRAEPALVAMTPEPLLEAPTYSAPALSRGRLYLRNEKRLLCLDLRASPRAD